MLAVNATIVPSLVHCFTEFYCKVCVKNCGSAISVV